MGNRFLFITAVAEGIVKASAQDASIPWDGIYPTFRFFWFTFDANIYSICSNLKSRGAIGEFHLSTRGIELPYPDPHSKSVILHIKVFREWYNSGILIVRAPT